MVQVLALWLSPHSALTLPVPNENLWAVDRLMVDGYDKAVICTSMFERYCSNFKLHVFAIVFAFAICICKLHVVQYKTVISMSMFAKRHKF